VAKLTVHVATPADVAAARAAMVAVMVAGDEIEVIVAQPTAKAAERQEARPAGGTAANMKG
jgi:hypothetical protein